MWLKASAEQQFLYGHNVMKSGLGRISESVGKYQGVVLYSMADVPLGFGPIAKSTSECRHTDPGTIVAFHQSDCNIHYSPPMSVCLIYSLCHML
jgi:60S ribosome subunit biogenesis protein NIP7